MSTENKLLLTVFDAELWQLGYEDTQEPNLMALTKLSNHYAQLKREYEQAPAWAKQSLLERLMDAEAIISAIDISCQQGRDYVGSVVASLYIEFERMRYEKDLDLSFMQQSLEVTNSIALTLCERQISLTDKQ